MSNVQYFNLSISAPRRLAMMRKDFAAHPVRYPHCPENVKPATWRGVRSWGLHNWQSAFATLSAGLNDGKPVWYSHNGPEFRDERDAHDVCNIGHDGWFTDVDAEETAIGIVARLTHGRFVAGYRWTSNDERVYFPEVFTDEDDAARMADEHARIFADNARACSERFNAMQHAEIECEEKTEKLREAWQCYKTARFSWVAMPDRFADELEHAKGEVCEALDALREARETLAECTAE